jgi:hypothetical protein
VVDVPSRAIELPHRAQSLVLEALDHARQSDDVGGDLGRRELVYERFDVGQQIEHVFASYAPGVTTTPRRGDAVRAYRSKSSDNILIALPRTIL